MSGEGRQRAESRPGFSGRTGHETPGLGNFHRNPTAATRLFVSVPLSSMDKSNPALRATFNPPPIDVLLEVVSYTDVSSAIKMTLVRNPSSPSLSHPDLPVSLRAARRPDLSTYSRSVCLSGHCCSTPSSLSGPFLGLQRQALWTTPARLS